MLSSELAGCELTRAQQGVLDILAGLPEHLCDRGALLRRLLAIERSAPAVEQASVLRELLQRWLPCGPQPKSFVAWANFLEHCTDTEARPLARLQVHRQNCWSADTRLPANEATYLRRF